MADRQIEDAFSDYYALQQWLVTEGLIVWDEDAGWEHTGKGIQTCIALLACCDLPERNARSTLCSLVAMLFPEHGPVEVITDSCPPPPSMN